MNHFRKQILEKFKLGSKSYKNHLKNHLKNYIDNFKMF